MGGRDQVHLNKIFVRNWICASIVESDNMGQRFTSSIFTQSETFCKTFAKLEQARQERRKMLVDGNLQTLSFNIRSIKLLVVKNYKWWIRLEILTFVCIQPEIFSSSIPLEMRAHPFGLCTNWKLLFGIKVFRYLGGKWWKTFWDHLRILFLHPRTTSFIAYVEYFWHCICVFVNLYLCIWQLRIQVLIFGPWAFQTLQELRMLSPSLSIQMSQCNCP